MEHAPIYSEIAQAPADGSAYWVYADDGVRLRVGIWHPPHNQNGTILFFTGRTEYVEKYGRTVTDFLNCGYSALIIDWRGQGLSDRMTKDRRTGHIDRFSDYQKDVAAMIKAATALGLQKPWYIVGNSMGCCIALRALSQGLSVTACAFTAPMWGICLSPIERLIAKPVSWAVQAVGKGHIYTPGRKAQSYVLSVPFDENDLTNDPGMYQYYIEQAKTLTQTQIGAPSMGWLYACLRECHALTNITAPPTPCITFLGDADRIVSIGAIENRTANWSGATLELVKNGKHDLLCEIPEIRDSVTVKICELFDRTAHFRRNL